MPDLLAGTTVNALDTPPTVSNTQNDSYTFTTTSFAVTTTGGTYNDCGVAFTAPTTGRVVIMWQGHISNSATNGTLISPVVRTGGTVGSGTSTVAASNETAIQTGDSIGGRHGATMLVESLTAGDTYNVRLEHRVTGGTGTALRRHVIVAPAT